MLLTPALSGHASVSGKIALVTDVAHVAAAAVWVGGLAALVLALLWAGRERWPLAVDAVPRFSGLAVVAVSWLIASGTVSGYLQVRALRGLWETTYGQLLLVKISLVLPLLALGLYNNRRAVPRLREQIASAGERTRFLRTAGAELALMVAIVSVTAVLVSEPPARARGRTDGAVRDHRPARRPRAQPRRRPGGGRPQRDPPLPDRHAGPADRRRRGIGLGDARQPSDRPAAPEGAPSRPRPLRRPRRSARARRRLAAASRDAPRRVRRRDGDCLSPDQKGITLMRKTLILARARGALVARAGGERARHRQPERGAGGQLLPLRDPCPDRAARCRHDQGRRAAAGGSRLRRLSAEAGLEADRDDGEAREADHERRGRDGHRADRHGDLGRRQDRSR